MKIKHCTTIKQLNEFQRESLSYLLDSSGLIGATGMKALENVFDFCFEDVYESENIYGDDATTNLSQEVEKSIFCVVDEYDVFGFAAVEVHDEEVYLSALYIDPCCRGNGLGENLLLKVKSYAKELGKFSVDLLVSRDNNHAREIYHKAGFLYNKYNIGANFEMKNIVLRSAKHIGRIISDIYTKVGSDGLVDEAESMNFKHLCDFFNQKSDEKISPEIIVATAKMFAKSINEEMTYGEIARYCREKDQFNAIDYQDMANEIGTSKENVPLVAKSVVAASIMLKDNMIQKEINKESVKNK